MDKEPITLTGLKNLKEELIFLKEKKKTQDSCSNIRGKIAWRSKGKC